MKIEFDTQTITAHESALLIDLLNKIKYLTEKETENSEPDGTAITELSEEEVSEIVNKMHKYALNLPFEKTFKATELYRAAIQGKWIDLPPNSRKAIGRQFKKVAEEHWESKKERDTVVEFKERNIQNTAIYHVVQKEEL